MGQNPVINSVHLSLDTARILGNTIVIINELDETSAKHLPDQFAMETKVKITSTGVKRKRLCQECFTPLAPEELTEHLMMGAWVPGHTHSSRDKTRSSAQITQEPDNGGQD